ncbi:MAG TPA: phosphatidate cytidylyltransferase [candidate division Zixibacteria bacterium]|nr:phosphatidate cytidylyltransferase [candidate division Zixibacteria bacterium]MDD4918227.1 phosphatidate cytidylyltransferase [candidate division Zixibacteria bacterium]MDM7971607.1 phosphatidate cytidylyltransferase [candidate division Zixibacteria bacterium]HOD66450.1 phosphatidate cytidylyltransferase [candidate division Zixibacteria bacterium]HOZ08535.1 phosphatidate cytidylyltransferase [candidate division Zixibacteria bacterium]
MSRNLALRILVAALFIPAILWIGYAGGWWLYAMLLVFLTVGLGEYLIREGYRLDRPVFWLTEATAVAVYSVVALPRLGVEGLGEFVIYRWHVAAAGLLAAFFLVSGMLFTLGKRPPAELFTRHCRLCWGLAYLSITWPIVFLVGSGVAGQHGGDSLLFLFGLLWVGDTAAMAVGKGLGRHKLSPAVSPNKTVEGFIGGIAGAAAIGVVMYFWKFEGLGLGHALAAAVGASVCGQLGDLVESMWKRSVGVKDSSAIIPGHGGVLDRFDSLLFAAPFLLLYFTLIR